MEAGSVKAHNPQDYMRNNSKREELNEAYDKFPGDETKVEVSF